MIAGDVRVWVATTPIDMRKSFDGLIAIVENFLQRDPQSGHLFVFRNKGGPLGEDHLARRSGLDDLLQAARRGGVPLSPRWDDGRHDRPRSAARFTRGQARQNNLKNVTHTYCAITAIRLQPHA